MRQDSTQQTIYEMTKQTVCMERRDKNTENKAAVPPLHAYSPFYDFYSCE